MDAIFEAYLAAQRRRRSSALTIKATTHALRATQRWLDEHWIEASELSLLQCEEYFDELPEQARSRRCAGTSPTCELPTATASATTSSSAIRRGCAVAVVAGHRAGDLQHRQLKTIHASVRSEREEVAFFLFAFAGLRLGEVAGLRWDQVDFDRWQIRLTGKGGKFRLVPLHPALNEVLRERQQRARPRELHVLCTVSGQRLAAGTLGRSIRELVDRAGVEVDSPCHAFRRTVATVMYERGVRTRVIERIMGWAPRRMHERHYLRVADEPMHDAIQTLYRDDPICERQTQTLRPEPSRHRTRTRGLARERNRPPRRARATTPHPRPADASLPVW